MAALSYLLDTHTLLWFQENNPRIPQDVMKLIQDTGNIIFFSQISLFEISIKQKTVKLPELYATIEEIYEQAIIDGFTFLNIQNSHIYNIIRLNFWQSIATLSTDYLSLQQILKKQLFCLLMKNLRCTKIWLTFNGNFDHN